MPEASKALVVYSNDLGSASVGEKMLNEARKAGICITAVLKTEYFSDNDSDVVDRVLEQAEKGLWLIIHKIAWLMKPKYCSPF